MTKLPLLFGEIGELAKSPQIGLAVELYQIFSSFLLGPTSETLDLLSMIPVLSYVHQYGNEPLLTMRQRQAGEDVDEREGFYLVEEDPMVEESTPNAVVIDWGEDEGEEGAVPIDIQWDIEVEQPEEGQKDSIDWDIEVEDPSNELEIAWDIDVEDVGLEVEDSLLEHSLPPEEDQSTSLMEHDTTRNYLLDDLYELQAFLQQRLIEIQVRDNLTQSSLLQSAPEKVSSQTLSSLSSMKGEVDKVLKALTTSELRMILDIKASTRYTERLVSSLKRRKDTIARMETLSQEVDAKQEEALENLVRLQLKKASLIKDATFMRASLQHQLSTAFSRPVNIVGQIHSILSL